VNGADVTIVQRSGTGKIRIFELTHANAVLQALTLRNGYQQGGGVKLSAGTVRDCVIRDNANNDSGFMGAGVYLSGGVVSNCVIRNNQTQNNNAPGGGVYAVGANALVTRCVIASNAATRSNMDGGGVYLDGGARLRNCLVNGNTAGQNGGGIYLTASTSTVENCTIVRNTASGGSGGGVYRANGVVSNSIVYLNSAVTAPNYSGAASGIAYSCADPLVANTGNISDDPQFVNPAAGNYRLPFGSDCVDAGATPDWAATGTDLDGSNRLQNSVIDMGAYEYAYGSEFAARVSATGRIGYLELTNVTLTAILAGTLSQTQNAHCVWNFGDGATQNGTDLLRVQHDFAPGAWTITLTVTNALSEACQAVRAGYVRVGAETVHVARAATPAYPYATEATAATNFAAAYAVYKDMRTLGADVPVRILVHTGDWAVAESVELTGDTRLASVGGCDLTALYRPSSGVLSFRVLRLDDSRVVVEGLTIRGGRQFIDPAEGAGVRMTAGILRDCVITNNNAVGGGSYGSHTYGGGVYASGGTIQDCRITGNQAQKSTSRCSGYGGGAYLLGTALLDSCHLDNNLAQGDTFQQNGSFGGGLYMAGSAVARNSLIRHNVANLGTTQAGGGVYLAGGVLENCTIATNSAGLNGGGVFRAAGAVTNCIVYFNTALTDPNYAGTNTAIAYSCTTPLVTNTGNIAADPLFMNAATNNFRLRKDSPCIDKGLVNPAWMAGATDLAGEPRLANKSVDMGAYETRISAGSLVVVR
jgi:parallel beta-helix repeat protein